MATRIGCPPAAKLADFQTGRLSDGARASLAGHLAGCEACRVDGVHVAAARNTLREIAEFTEPAQASLSSARIEAMLRWSRSLPTVETPRRAWAWGFAAAVAASAAAVIALRMTHRSPHEERPAQVAIAAPMIAPLPRPPGLEAQVTLVGGDARVFHGDTAAEALDPSQRITSGDRITTAAGARVALQWGEGSGALIGSASELALARLETRAQDLSLLRGQVAVRVGPHQPGEALRVMTPDHSISVRGTWFVVSVDARGTNVEVLEGVVEVAALEGDGSSTRIAAPQRAFFPRGRGVGEGARALSGSRAGALRLATEMDLLPWAGIDKAFSATGMLAVASTPPASLVVDGVPFGLTPLDLRRSRGRHLVEISRSGFATIRRWVTVGDEPGDLRVALKADSDRPTITPPEPDEVRQVVDRRKRQIESCYEHGLKRFPDLAGTITLEIQIGIAGQVLATQVENDTLANADVVACLRREAAGWSFEKARNATIVYPFVFQSR